ncbi:MAG: TatD family deoxyribonuclease [Ruminococcaceae bacterium]|nr:TatD family deoxyribonuclease [Oscillospiraceae bacterium]
MLFDTHAHLNDSAFDEDRDGLITGLAEKGVGLVMNAGCDLESSKECIALAEKYPFLYASVGSHPDSADEICDEVLEKYLQMSRHPKVKAIGEIGLDYYYENFDKGTQIRAFEMQMELARQADLPVIVHERDAHGDGMNVVGKFPEISGVFHCYSGSAEMAQQLVSKGWYIGFTGVLTFKNARKAVETAESIPLERIVLETDCPYMSPEPFRGKRNDPGRLPYMAQKLAEIRGLPVEEIIRITTENAKRLYRI